MLTLVIFTFMISAPVWCQRGLFYGEKLAGNSRIAFPTPTDKNVRKNILVDLNVPIYFYGKSFRGDGKIHTVRVSK